MTLSTLDCALDYVIAWLRGRGQGIVLCALLESQVPTLILERIDGEGVDAAVIVVPLSTLVSNDPQVDHFIAFQGDHGEFLAGDFEQVIFVGNDCNQPMLTSR